MMPVHSEEFRAGYICALEVVKDLVFSGIEIRAGMLQKIIEEGK